MIGQEALPEALVTRCLDILRILSSSERDLIRVVVEVVHELRDPLNAEEEEIAVRQVMYKHIILIHDILIERTGSG